jgi:hypothetical protein
MINDRNLGDIEVDETNQLRMKPPTSLFPGSQFQSRPETSAAHPLRMREPSLPESVHRLAT